jgi:hypothetical protein
MTVLYRQTVAHLQRVRWIWNTRASRITELAKRADLLQRDVDRCDEYAEAMTEDLAAEEARADRAVLTLLAIADMHSGDHEGLCADCGYNHPCRTYQLANEGMEQAEVARG